jgi:hypothetical protein
VNGVDMAFLEVWCVEVVGVCDQVLMDPSLGVSFLDRGV